ncbi:alpha/beta-hydrolase [Coprinellus micaceus]|uniref:Alpha/beta-hydrolase n=1 Tax=Coprinellus micaceus TaxID=71717 RepID=A0A4Y7SCR9_COPMI|nr:alpha/beta-hydrolase [Coprinellus micaceus]
MVLGLNATASVVEKFVTSSDGVEIFAQAVGDSRLPTLIFIHGLALSALVWVKILRDANLLKSFQLVAYDLRGHGRSGKPDTLSGYSSELYAQDFAAVLKTFGIKSPILVGWSLGATIAADVTTYIEPDTLAGVVYTAALPWLGVNQIVATEWVQSLIPGLLATNDSNLSISTRIEFGTQLFNHPEAVPTDVLWSWIGSTILQPPSKFGFLMGRTQDTTKLFEAGGNGLPLLVINGGADKYIDGEKVLEVVDGHFKDLTVHTVKNGSHAFFYEDQAEFVRELVKFGKRVFAQGPKPSR